MFHLNFGDASVIKALVDGVGFDEICGGILYVTAKACGRRGVHDSDDGLPRATGAKFVCGRFEVKAGHRPHGEKCNTQNDVEHLLFLSNATE